MEQNLPIISKKIWKMIRLVCFMLPNRNFLADLIKRGKVAGKAAFRNLIFHPRLLVFAAKRGGSAVASPPFDFAEMAAALEIFSSAAASPALPGFGPSPVVRQLRITDSPFPLRESEEDCHVDEAAEEFIVRFYEELKKQNSMVTLGCS